MSGLSSKEEERRKENRYSRLVRALLSFPARKLAIQLSVALPILLRSTFEPTWMMPATPRGNMMQCRTHPTGAGIGQTDSLTRYQDERRVHDRNDAAQPGAGGSVRRAMGLAGVPARRRARSQPPQTGRWSTRQSYCGNAPRIARARSAIDRRMEAPGGRRIRGHTESILPPLESARGGRKSRQIPSRWKMGANSHVVPKLVRRERSIMTALFSIRPIIPKLFRDVLSQYPKTL